MSHLFNIGGNPFGTQVGQLIEKATDGSQPSENWALYLEVCDLINALEEGPKDALKAMKKRLSHNAGKNYQVVLFTLTLLETCVKNCGRRIHIQIAHKDFLQDLIKIIGPKNDPPQVVQEKILGLIQNWADAFQGIPELKEVGKVYNDLKHKGIEFPPTDLDHMAPIDTPARTAPGMDPPVAVPQRTPSSRGSVKASRSPGHAHTLPYPTQAMPQQAMPQQVVPAHGPHPQATGTQGPVMLQPDQLAKLKTELDIVQQNIKVFSEMMTELSPGQENPSDLELLQDLNRTCRQMQHRIVDLIEKVQNEEVTGELLRLNDELNNVFLRHERFERLRATQLGTTVASPAGDVPAGGVPAGFQPAAATGQGAHDPPPYPAAEEPIPIANLIDFGDSPQPQQAGAANPADISLQLAGLNVGANTVSGTLDQINTTTATNAGPDEDFDMFAQSRQSFEQSKQTPAASAYVNQTESSDTYAGGLGAAVTARSAPPQAVDKESDYDEMEKWLKQNPEAGQQESATSSEFDQFLAQRAGEAGPIPAAAGTQQQEQGASRSGRQMQKDDPENALFAL